MTGCEICGYAHQQTVVHMGRRFCFHCVGVLAEKRAKLPEPVPWYSRALAWFAGSRWGL